ncbi:hypothetical protein IFM89_009243 [Coptis chinensis]|uniref:KIB1-4 beta-propeller domain-containing protein n=1 Tax=Coptis chinensis TaxID=261450 RepID=A0A835ID17_9MAGN|nr:hypothetical protein IFM89_009243 [Coptis chinensis]
MHGWLVMTDLWLSAEVHCFLWNPDTRKKVDLPSWSVKRPEDVGMCILLSPPTDPDCMVLFAGENFFLTWQLGDKNWTKHNYELVGKDPDDTIDFIHKVISCKDGNIYALTIHLMVAVIDRESCGNLSVRLLDFERPPSSKSFSFDTHHLVESCGEIFLVVIMFLGQTTIEDVHYVEIFKMDLSKEVWVKVESLGDRVFFVTDDRGNMSLPATKFGLKGNCIYFSIRDKNGFYIFDLGGGNLSNCMPWRPNLLEQPFTPFWFLPNNRQTGCNFEDEYTDTKKELTMEMADNKYAILKEHVEEYNKLQLNDLPMDILRLIALYLPSTADYLNFGRVCKSFASSIPQIPLTTQYPQLMFSKRRNSVCSFYDPMYNVTYCFDMPELLGARVHFSKDGWLLISKDNYKMSFFNPFTKVTVELPDLPEHYTMNGLSFTQAPISTDCVVFGIAWAGASAVQILYLHLGEDAWTHEGRHNEVDFFPSNNNPVFHDGAFYCLGAERYLGVFDLRDYTWTIHLTPEPCSSIQQNFLVENDGELLSVFVGQEGEYVHLYKLDRSNMYWEVLSNLEDQMLFVSRSTSLLMKATSEKMQNKIYFPLSYGNRNNYLFYSLETQRWQSSLGGYLSEDIYNTEEKLHCTWI